MTDARVDNVEPLITVLMPVYNGEQYVRAAIDSVLGQTYKNFELLIIDDGSTDASARICAEYQDPRMLMIANDRNLGLIATLNRGLALARGEYIARVDCDDINLPERFERQVRFMEQHPEVGVCGTWFERMTETDSQTIKVPADDNIIRFFLVFDNAFGHNTILFRKNFLQEHGLRYDSAYQYAEDYEFWVRCSRYTRLANIPEVLVNYRFHPANTSTLFRGEQNATADRVRALQLQTLGLNPSEEELALHCALLRFCFDGDYARLVRARDWLDKLADLTTVTWAIPPALINQVMGVYWYGACGVLAGEGWRVWCLFRSVAFGRRAPWVLQAKLLFRCLSRMPIPQGK